MDARVVQLVTSVLTEATDRRLAAVLQDVVDNAREVIRVRYAAIGVLDATGMLERFVHSGVDEATVAEIGHLPRGRGLLGWQSTHAAPLRLDELTAHPASVGFPPGHPTMTSLLSVPVWIDGEQFGNLYMSDRLDGAPFDDDDEDVAVVLAALVGTAVANVRRQTELRRLTLIEDRERLGRDLHDLVIQRIFATGLSLQGLARRVEHDDPEAADRLTQAVADLDGTIRTVRSAIFSLSVDDPEAPVTARIRRLVGDELPRVLGLTPDLDLVGPLDEVTSPVVAAELVAVLREALTNVAKHADASRVDVRVALCDGWLEVTVSDDGVGISDTGTTGMGLRNMMDRAVRLGGEVSVDGARDGAAVSWRVPIAV